MWKMQTIMKQAGRELVLAADCRGDMDDLDGRDFAFTFANWDNRSGESLDFEWASGECPQPVTPCYDSEVTISNFELLEADLFLEDYNDDDGGDGDFGPAEWGTFLGWTDFHADTDFFIKGLDGRYLETEESGFSMGTNNRAVVTVDEDMDEVYVE